MTTTNPHASTVPAPPGSYVDRLTTPTVRPARAIHSSERLDKAARGRHRGRETRLLARIEGALRYEEPSRRTLAACSVLMAQVWIHRGLSLHGERVGPLHVAMLRQAQDDLAACRAPVPSERFIPLDVLAECEVRPMRSAMDNPSMRGDA